VLQGEVNGTIEEDIDDYALGWSDDYVFDELLVLHMAAVAADQLHPGSRHSHPEDTGVGGVSEVEADDLAELRAE
jgi:hypothetical protein